MKLIDKDALVAEIEKKIKQYEAAFNNPSLASYEASLIAKGKYRKLLDILQFLDTLEVMEIGVDLGDPKGDKSAKYIIDTKTLEVKEVDLEEKATQLSQKYFPDEENIWARANIEAQNCKSACIEMVEWFKAQKGE